MDRGPRGPHESCATFRTQRVDMQSMWRQGRWCRTRTLVSPHQDSSRWSAHHALSKLTNKKLNQTHKRHKTYGVTPLIAEVGTWQLGWVPPPFGRTEAQTRTPQASRGSNLHPNGDATYAAWYVCEAGSHQQTQTIKSRPQFLLARASKQPCGGATANNFIQATA